MYEGTNEGTYERRYVRAKVRTKVPRYLRTFVLFTKGKNTKVVPSYLTSFVRMQVKITVTRIHIYLRKNMMSDTIYE